MFNSIIRQRYESDSSNILPHLARPGQYAIRRLPTHEEVSYDKALASVFRPGSRLVMSLHLEYDESYADCCPACSSPDAGVEGVTRICACGILYTRVPQYQAHVVMFPAHMTPAKQPEQLHEKDDQGNSKQEVQQEVTSAPDSEPTPPRASDMTRLHNLGSAKNVEITPPLMASIIDLLGYTYMVPWSIARTVDGILFFLQWIAGGGSLVQWPQDYMLVDDVGSELTTGNWKSETYPGISIKLTLRAQRFNSMRLEFGSRIQDALSRSSLFSFPTDAKAATEEACSLLNVAPSQVELEEIVGESVRALSQGLSQASSATSNAREIIASHWLCHVCQEKSSTCSAHKKHVQSHLVALRCPRECGICDLNNLPGSVKEHFAQGQSKRKPGPPVSSLIMPSSFAILTRAGRSPCSAKPKVRPARHPSLPSTTNEHT